MKTKYIKDPKTGENILPITSPSAVIDENGTSINTRLTNDESKISSNVTRITKVEHDIDNTYTKQEVDNLITTPNVKYENYQATTETSIDQILPAQGKSDTIYKIGSWDGTNTGVDTSVYSEYTWDGTTYKLLAVRSSFNDVFDISEATGNSYETLSAALTAANSIIPSGRKKGGMSIKFVQSSDNKYVQYMLMLSGSFTDTQFTNTANWQGVDEKPITSSKNLIESGGVAKGFLNVEYGKIINEEELTVVSGYYNTQAITVGDYFSRPISETETVKCLKKYVLAGDVYEITGKGISDTVGSYVLTNSNKVVIDMAKIADYRTNSKKLYIKEAGLLYVNLADYDANTDGVKQLIRDSSKSIDGLYNQVNTLVECINGSTWTAIPVTGDGKYINCTAATVGGTFNPTSSGNPYEGAAYWRIPVVRGEIYAVKAEGNGNVSSLYVLTGDEHIVLDKVGKLNSKSNAVILNIEENGELFVNDIAYSSTPGSVEKITGGIKEDVFNLDDRVTVLENSQIDVVDNLTTDDATKALSAKQGKILNEKIDGVEIEDDIPQTPTSTSAYYNCNTATVGSAFSKTSPKSLEGAACWKISVNAGEKYKVYAKGNGNNGALYVLTGNNDIVLAKVGAFDSKQDGITLNILENGYLYVNDVEYSVSAGSVQKVIITIEGGYKEYVDSKLAGYNSPIKGKKIVFFGDSMVTVQDSSHKDLTQYIEEKTSATCYNFAIGGTKIAQRAEPTLNPQNTTEAYADLDICNMVEAACTGDYRYVDAGASIITGDDVGNPINVKIAAMKALDWSTIDIIVIEGGGNDYFQRGTLGATDSFDKNTLLGGVNYIIQSVCQTYKKAKVIGLSNVVVYRSAPEFSESTQYYAGEAVSYNNGTRNGIWVFITDHLGAWDNNDVREGDAADWRTNETFSDNAKNTRIGTDGMTLREIVAAIETQYEYYHLPYADVYNYLGWNQYNFSEYFLDTDNHHPRKGLSQLADGIISHLENLVK